jgi:hypothetical protein
MNRESEQNLSRAEIPVPLDTRGIFSSGEERIRSKDLGLACMYGLRSGYPEYDLSEVGKIVKDTRMGEFKKARVILNATGIDVVGIGKKKEDLGFLGNNLTHGFVGPMERVAVSGVCFPERATLQSVLALLAIKDLLDIGKVDSAYLAMPIFAYAGAGLDRSRQYLENISLMRKIFGDQLGENVFIVPDNRVEIKSMKYDLCNLRSRFVGDEPAREKYQFGNLFGYFETASYGADILLPAFAEGRGVTAVCDFRQFESIHAGMKMAGKKGPNVGALLYTLIAPYYTHDGKVREVSQDTDTGFVHQEGELLPETSSLFYQAVMLFSEAETTELYDQIRKGIPIGNLSERVSNAKRRLLSVSPAREAEARDLEDKSIKKLLPARDIINEQVNDIMRGQRTRGLYVQR